MRPPDLGVISDRRRLAAALGLTADDALEALVAQAAAAAACGVAFYQVREPDLDASALLALTTRLVAAARPLPVFVNDRVDVAVAAGAHVHLKGVSLPAARVRPWLPDGTRVSRAVHSLEELTEAGAVDVVIAGTVAATVSKGPDAPLLGLGGLSAVCGASTVPVYAIGGVTPGSWPALAAAGARGCAAIGAFLPRAGESIDEAMRRATTAFRGVD